MHAELVDAQADQQRHGPGIACHLTADANPSIVGMSGPDYLIDDSKERWMKAVREVSQVRIGPIGGEQVLG